MMKNSRPKKMNIISGIDIGSAKIRCAIIANDDINNTNKLLGIGTSNSTGNKSWKYNKSRKILRGDGESANRSGKKCKCKS